MLDILISGPSIYTPNGRITNKALGIQGEKIAAFYNEDHPAKEQLHFPAHYHLVPGMIDLHIHGTSGKDVMDADALALDTIAKTLAKQGITGFLATTMTAPSSQIEAVLKNIALFIKQQKNGACLLGVHLEGPFLSPKKVGAQNQDHLQLPDIQRLKQWQKLSGNHIKLVTLAPELKNSLDLIRYLKKENIVASLGHTDATYEESLTGIQAGCTHVTHLFNAMRGIHQREPGVVTAALLSDAVTVECIADGEHLHPAVIELILKIKNKEKIILVTDAMRAQCMQDGIYDLGGQSVHVKNQVARLSDGQLAGSTLTLPMAIKNLLRYSGKTLMDILPFVTENPAKVLNIFQETGSIESQKSADLVVLDDELHVVLTMVAGKVIYRR